MTILPKACVCGHDHETSRGERVELCLECSCDDFMVRCQSCGEEAVMNHAAGSYDVCSQRCALQMGYALALASTPRPTTTTTTEENR